jgi:hypothetical protein
MDETLLTGSAVWLFGRIMKDLSLNGGEIGGKGALAMAMKGDKAGLARVYAFGYEGQVIPLATPAIFLVHGKGEDGDPAKLGLASDNYTLPDDMKAWGYDRADMTLRLDMMTGTFDRLLIDYEIGGGLQGYARGGSDVGQPSPLRAGPARRGRRWRSEDE